MALIGLQEVKKADGNGPDEICLGKQMCQASIAWMVYNTRPSLLSLIEQH
jgi:hypothetical protein